MKNMGTLASRLRAFKLQITATAAMALLAGQVMAQDAQVWKLQTTDAQQKQAAEAGAADGKSKGTATLPTEKKIGVVLLSGQSASSNRILEPVKALAELLKFEVITCDPNFDAQKVAQCATSMIAQSASAIFTISTSPGPMGSALRDAKDAGIPVIGMVSSVQPTPLIIQYGSPGVASAQLSAKWLFDNAKQRKGPDAKLKFMLLTAPTVGLANLIEEQEVIKAAAANPNVEIVIKHDLDLGNIVQDTIAMSKQAVQQHPDLAGIWTVCDLCIPLISQALDGEGVTGDKRPIIVGDYTTAQTVDLIRKGKVDGVMDLPLEASVWVGFDQLLSFWSKETPINTSYDVFEKGYGLKFMEPYILTKANTGASGPIPVISSDYESYFRAKWKAEYGL
ncbi:MAG: substrate-binding domain-containing protein [Agrobacterium vaccinii]